MTRMIRSLELPRTAASSSRTATPGQGSQLDWEPGWQGKGVVLRNGEVVTWPAQGTFDNMHYEVMAERGVPAADIKVTFEIDLDGTVSVLEGVLEQEDAEALEDAGLRPQEMNAWNFG